MRTDLADFKDGIPERFVPDQMRGELLEAEHLGRYMWASQQANGRRALDAGCGVGYGSALLARAGASEVVGVDVADAVLDSVRESMPVGVSLRPADVRELPFPDRSFDLVVCFEVIEHIEDPAPALDELCRVLSDDGLLLISSPNRAVYPPVNPHHHHEFLPEELASQVRARLGHSSLLRQHVYLTSAILDDAEFQTSDAQPLDVPLLKLAADEPGQETFTLAIGSRYPVPSTPRLALLASDLELKRWFAVTDDQQAQLEAHSAYIGELREKLTDLDETQDRLITAEQRLAVLPDLEATIAWLEGELEHARRELHSEHSEREIALVRVQRADRVLAEVMGSPSWKLTAPLRRSKHVLRRILR